MFAKFQPAIVLFLTVALAESATLSNANASDYGKLEILEISQPTTSKSQLNIDIRTCICLEIEMRDECEIAIFKSTILDIDCPQDSLFCCKETQSILPTADDNASVTEGRLTNTDPNVKIRHILTDELEDSSLDEKERTGDEPRGFLSSSSTPLNSFSPVTTVKIRQQCVCRIRENCPEKFVDYGFGFHCTYDKVRCCGGEENDSPNTPNDWSKQGATEHKNLNSNDTVIIPTLNDTEHSSSVSSNKSTTAKDLNSNEYDEQLEEEDNVKCYCLPINQCQITEENLDNLVWRRQDTLCPGETVQCCGNQVEIFTGTLDGEDVEGRHRIDEQVDETTTILDKLDDKVDNHNRFNNDQRVVDESSSTIMGGQGAFLQPIQLPERKIPLSLSGGEFEGGNVRPATSTLSPPELPTYYNYQPPKYYSGYYYPNQQVPQQLFNSPSQTTPTYNDGYVRYPWSREPSHFSDSVPGGHRGISQPYPIEEHPRSSPNTSLLDKIANILG